MNPVRLHRRRPRSGIYVVEILTVVPLVLLALLAVIEFGLLYINFRHVAAASRTGAKIAAEQMVFNIAAIKTEVDRHLLSAGFSAGSSEVILQHNVGSVVPIVISSAGMIPVAPYPTTPTLPLAAVVPEGCVRITVAVPMSLLTPDLLALFGYSVATQTKTKTVTFPYEGT